MKAITKVIGDLLYSAWMLTITTGPILFVCVVVGALGR